ncbi:MAG TPA: response regulator [Dongiaceae bacterium]|jgi:DNA-binding NarL/FixJ family response regulator|nr:response regulator [Dongiaceae bacterium]
MLNRILFVDDQPQILDGIRRMLRPKRDRWDMHFAGSGAEALTLMETAPFDVVVTDMRMPQMTGAELLFEVKHRHPDTMRIVLSGYYEQENVYRCVGAAHQYLMKPCDSATISASIDRALKLHALITAPPLRNLVGKLSNPPRLSEACQALLKDIEIPDASMEIIAAIVDRHASASYPRDELPTATLNRLKADMLGASLTNQYGASFNQSASVAIWSRHVAAMAEALMKHEGADPMTMVDAYCSGLLASIGVLVLAANYPDQYADLTNSASSLEEKERAVFGASHAQLGAYLLHYWGFNNASVIALAYHHCPEEAEGAAIDPVTVVHVAESMLGGSHGCSNSSATLNQAYLEAIGLGDHLGEWRHLIPGGDMKAPLAAVG